MGTTESTMQKARRLLAAQQQGLSFAQLAKQFKVTRQTAYNLIQLTTLDPELQAAVEDDSLPVHSALKLVALTHAKQRAALKRLVGRPREFLERWLAELKSTEEYRALDPRAVLEFALGDPPPAADPLFRKSLIRAGFTPRPHELLAWRRHESETVESE